MREGNKTGSGRMGEAATVTDERPPARSVGKAKTAKPPRKIAARVPPAAKLREANLVGFFRGPNQRMQLSRVAKYFNMTHKQLLEVIGCSPSGRGRNAVSASPKVQSRTCEMLEIIGRVTDWAGSEIQAMAWYRAEPLPSFGDRTAESLVKQGMAAAVRDYLDRVATGGFA